MPLLEEFEQCVQERADDSFPLFLEAFERRWHNWRRYEGREVEKMLRRCSKPTVTQLCRACRKMPNVDFAVLTDRWSALMVKAGLRADGSGGYHALRAMDTFRLEEIMRELEEIRPPLAAFYRTFRENASAWHMRYNQLSVYHRRDYGLA